MVAAATLQLLIGQVTPAESLLEQAVRLSRDIDDQRTLAWALGRLCWAKAVQGQDLDGSLTLGNEAVRIARVAGDPMMLAWTLNDLASTYGEREHSRRAIDLTKESLQLFRSIGYVPGIAETLNNLGWHAILAGDHPAAVAYLKESLKLAHGLSQRLVVTMAQDNLALAHLFGGEPERAERLFRENLRLCRATGDQRIAEEALIGLAGTAAQMREWVRAAWLAGAAAAQRARLNLLPGGVNPLIEDRFLADARGRLGDDGYGEVFERGRQAPLEQAVALALEEAAEG
jgi:tetratricopeptide (TPR) repeat protein